MFRKLLPVAALLCLIPCASVAETPDWQLYAELLREHVTSGTKEGVRLNLVDYTGLKRDRRFDELVATVSNFDVARLETRSEKLSFYINAYNILTIKLILDHWPVESIRDIGNFFQGPWDIVMLENSAGRYTLDDIEHEIIRSLGEPRIHFAVNCASISCPDLRREPFEAEDLDRQLADQTRRFLAEPSKGLFVEGGIAHVTKLFDWYGGDFAGYKGAGSISDGITAFVHEHTEAIEFKRVKPDLDYNWQLNGS